MGCLSTYGIGSAPPYYGTGYVPQASRSQPVCCPALHACKACLSALPVLLSKDAWLHPPPAPDALIPQLPLHSPEPRLDSPRSPVQAKWYQFGFIFSVIYLATWVFLGGAWWKVRGGVLCAVQSALNVRQLTMGDGRVDGGGRGGGCLQLQWHPLLHAGLPPVSLRAGHWHLLSGMDALRR